jgi:AcrR family transcriptional regulator
MVELSQPRIAQAALTILDQEGANALTIRAVAKVLGVTPMALYNHVENKAALMALVVETALGEHPLPLPSGEGWREDLSQMALWIRASVRTHPNVGRLRTQLNLWTPASLKAIDRWCEVWQQSGLEPEIASSAALTSCLAIVGLAHQELFFEELQVPDEEELKQLPHVRPIFEAGRTAPVTFELLAHCLIDGLWRRFRPVPAETATVPPTRRSNGSSSRRYRKP